MPAFPELALFAAVIRFLTALSATLHTLRVSLPRYGYKCRSLQQWMPPHRCIPVGLLRYWLLMQILCCPLHFSSPFPAGSLALLSFFLRAVRSCTPFGASPRVTLGLLDRSMVAPLPSLAPCYPADVPLASVERLPVRRLLILFSELQVSL